MGTRGVPEQHERGGLDAGRPRRGRAVGERAEHVLDGHRVGDAVAGRADDDRHRHDALPGQRGGQRLQARRDGAAPPPAGDHHDDRRLGHPVGQVREGGQPGPVLVADRAGAGCRASAAGPRPAGVAAPRARRQRRPGPRSRRAPATSRLQYPAHVAHRSWTSAHVLWPRQPSAFLCTQTLNATGVEHHGRMPGSRKEASAADGHRGARAGACSAGSGTWCSPPRAPTGFPGRRRCGSPRTASTGSCGCRRPARGTRSCWRSSRAGPDGVRLQPPVRRSLRPSTRGRKRRCAGARPGLAALAVYKTVARWPTGLPAFDRERLMGDARLRLYVATLLEAWVLDQDADVDRRAPVPLRHNAFRKPRQEG